MDKGTRWACVIGYKERERSGQHASFRSSAMFPPRIPPSAICKRSYATVSVQPPLRGLNSIVRDKAEKLSRDWKGTSASGENTKNFIGGEFVQSKATQWIEVVDPVRCGPCLSSHLNSTLVSL